MTQRIHRMAFGAEPTDHGTRFRLWAPTAHQVELLIEEQPHPLNAIGAGWYETTLTHAGPGTRYRYRIDNGLAVPDPASRYQPEDVHGPSEVIDPTSYRWDDRPWPGRPWQEAVIYELHVGSFTPEGSFLAAIHRLDHLVALGVTAIELMPVADFPGRWNWGYDGVLPFAPDARYGRPEELKALVEAAHARGLMVLLDVVYNHFGPEGNYLHLYAKPFFTQRHHTPWGEGLNFDGEQGAPVRRFFIDNALYWLTEYHLDGLRLDAVHAILDDSERHLLTELAEEVHRQLGDRPIHLVLENDANQARYLAERTAPDDPTRYRAQWNDDLHHLLHLLACGEQAGYYADYAEQPAHLLGRCLAEGFAYQGEASRYRDGEQRGEPSGHLPPTAFVNFIQNHDQIGNRAFGERLHQLAPPAAVRAVTAILLLAPSPPLLFMGQEWGAPEPFLFFCDFGPDLAGAVTEGRRREFARFPEFADPAARARIPDPESPTTFERSRLNWETLATEEAQQWLTLHRELLTLRQHELVPRIGTIVAAQFQAIAERVVTVSWQLASGARLTLLTNLAPTPHPLPPPAGRPLYSSDSATDHLPPWSVYLALQERV